MATVTLQGNNARLQDEDLEEFLGLADEQLVGLPCRILSLNRMHTQGMEVSQLVKPMGSHPIYSNLVKIVNEQGVEAVIAKSRLIPLYMEERRKQQHEIDMKQLPAWLQ